MVAATLNKCAMWVLNKFTAHLCFPRGLTPSSGGDAAVCVFDINRPSLPIPFYSVFVSVSVFVALSTVFHSINSPDNSSPSHSVLRSYFSLLILSTIYLFMKVPFSPDIILCG